MKKLTVNAPINQTGYGIASLNIIRELGQKLNLHNISYFPIGNPVVDNQNDADMAQYLINNQYQFFDPDATLLKIWHQFDLISRVGNRGKYIAFPFFELDTFNFIEKLSLRVPDIILATSDWAKSVIENQIPNSNVAKVPLGVDTKIFSPKKSNDIQDKYVFLNIGKWEVRKGHDVLLDIFNKAFPNNENVELWILAPENTNSYANREELIQWKKMYDDRRVKIFTGFQSHAEVADLISQSDCGIYPSRAEGWNLELLETMAMNKPVIATNYSAHTEFCNNENCFLIPITETEKAYDGKAFSGQGNWAKLNNDAIEAAISHMRTLYAKNIRTNEEGVKTAIEYSWANTANNIIGCIDSL